MKGTVALFLDKLQTQLVVALLPPGRTNATSSRRTHPPLERAPRSPTSPPSTTHIVMQYTVVKTQNWHQVAKFLRRSFFLLLTSVPYFVSFKKIPKQTTAVTVFTVGITYSKDKTTRYGINNVTLLLNIFIGQAHR